MMDVVKTEEVNPLPLPVEKKFSKQYVNEPFKHRHAGAKNRLIIDGKIRILNKEERIGVEIMMPTQEGLEDWNR